MIPELAVVVPVLNEADNIQPFLEELDSSLAGIDWEVIFVDDASSDGTAAAIESMAKRRSYVRTIQRIGRHGLASACIEGACSTFANYVAVMDADLQHDPRILPQMLESLQSASCNLAVGTRYAREGSLGEWSTKRRRASQVATKASHFLLRTKDVSDPMSGFFMVDRQLFLHTVPRLCGKGFKILLDIMATAGDEIQVKEFPYTFRNRLLGSSKLSFSIVTEFGVLLLDKTVGRVVPYRFVLFVMMGCIGAVLHLSVLGVMYKQLGVAFWLSQGTASVLAMIANFSLNNSFTHRDRKLTGFSFVKGLLGFIIICSVGAFANIQIAVYFLALRVPWWISGLLGAFIGSVWNYAVSSTLVWKRR